MVLGEEIRRTVLDLRFTLHSDLRADLGEVGFDDGVSRVPPQGTLSEQFSLAGGQLESFQNFSVQEPGLPEVVAYTHQLTLVSPRVLLSNTRTNPDSRLFDINLQSDKTLHML